MSRNITIKNIDVSLNMADVLKHMITIASGLKDKEILSHMIVALSSHNVEAIRIVSETLVQMKEVIHEFYVSRVEEYRRSQRLRRILGFVSSARIEREANELALVDVRQLTNVITGSEDKMGTFRANSDAIQQAVAQLICLVREKAVNLEVNKINKMLEADYEIE